MSFFTNISFAQIVSVNNGNYDLLPENQIQVTLRKANLEFSTTDPEHIKYIPQAYGSDATPADCVMYYGQLNWGEVFTNTTTPGIPLAETAVDGTYTLRYKNSATLPNNKKGDVLITVSDWKIYLAKFRSNNPDHQPDSNYYFKSMAIGTASLSANTQTPNTDPTNSEAFSDPEHPAGVNSYYAQKFKISIKIVEPGTNTPVNAEHVAFLVDDLDSVDQTYLANAMGTERYFKCYNGPYNEGVELIRGFYEPIILSPESEDVETRTLVKVTEVDGNTRIDGDEDKYVRKYNETGEMVDTNTLRSGFVSIADPAGFEFYWTGSTKNQDAQMGTRIFKQPTVAVKATTGSGGTIEKKGTTSYTWGSSTTYKYTPNNGYHVKSLKVDGEDVDFNPNGGTYEFEKLYKDPMGNNNTYTINVTYEANPAKVLAKYVDEGGNEITDQSIINGYTDDNYTTSPKTVSGYTLKEAPANQNGKMAPGTTEVVYVYKKNPIIHFDPNGADNSQLSVEDLTLDNDKVYFNNVRQFYWVRENYILGYWNTEPGGSGKSYYMRYNDTTSKYNALDFDEDEVTLYAQWIPAYTRIRYDGNGATSGEMSEEFQTVDKEYTIKENEFERIGYRFTGWTVNEVDKQSGDILTDFNGTIHGEAVNPPASSVKRYKADLSREGMNAGDYWYGQGATFFEKDGKKYLVSAFVTNGDSPAHGTAIVVFDAETGEVVKTKTRADFGGKSLGHMNDFYYDKESGHIFIARGTVTAGVDELGVDENGKLSSLLEFDTDLNFIRDIKLYKSNGQVLGSLAQAVKQGDYWYVKQAQRFYVYDKDFQYVSDFAATDSRYDQMVKTIYAQGVDANDKYYYNAFFTGETWNGVVTVTKMDSIKSGNSQVPESYYFPFIWKDTSTMDGASKNKREIQDFYIDGDDLYIFSIKGGGNVYVQKYEDEGIPTTTIVAQWEPLQYKIKTNVVNGNITEDQTVNYGDDCKIDYSPKPGYQIKSITVDGNPVSITDYPDNYDFSNVTGDHEITVTYEPMPYDLTLKNTVSGNMASRDYKFEFDITIKNATPNTAYKNDSGETLFTTDANGNGKLAVKLAHEEGITIKDLPYGSTYQISETESFDYNVSYEIDSTGTIVKQKDSTENTQIETMDVDETVIFKNSKVVIIPTGINGGYTSGIIAIAICGIGAGLMVYKKRKPNQ